MAYTVRSKRTDRKIVQVRLLSLVLIEGIDMAKKVRSVRKGRVFKDFKDRREYQTPLTPDDFPDPPHFSLLPFQVREKLKQDITKMTRSELDALLRINKQCEKEYNKKNSKRKKR